MRDIEEKIKMQKIDKGRPENFILPKQFLAKTDFGSDSRGRYLDRLGLSYRDAIFRRRSLIEDSIIDKTMSSLKRSDYLDSDFIKQNR